MTWPPKVTKTAPTNLPKEAPKGHIKRMKLHDK